MHRKGAASRAEGPWPRKEYWHFCLDHVREYNQAYNFFQGMSARCGGALSEGRADRSPADLEDGRQRRQAQQIRHPEIDEAHDPLSMFCELNGRASWRPGPGSTSEAKPETRKVLTPSARRCR